MRLPHLLTVLALLTFTSCAHRAPTPAADLARMEQANEVAAIALCRAYYSAQIDYARADRNEDGAREYAREFRSSRDQRSIGLQLTLPAAPPGERPFDGHHPYRGYYYKILTRQGAHAPGGVRDYMVGKHLTGGFALLAWPAHYGTSGRLTFLVNQTGRVLQKDLGPATAKLAQHTTTYDPDASWAPAK